MRKNREKQEFTTIYFW